ncbi:MAG: hypothetical protein HY721_28780 [Planctomycetes bacterium]|nr:hypothetical protein [Planctomycetota bacterium]
MRAGLRVLGPALAVGLLVLPVPAAPAAPAAPPAPTGPAPGARAAFDEGLRLFREAQELARTRPSEHEEIARHYRAAAEGFVRAWKAGAATTEVFTNAANSFHFAGAAGEAVLFWRRALAVDPANRRAREALEHIRASLPIRRPSSGTGPSIARTLFFWHGSLSLRARKGAFLVLFPLAIALFAAALFRRRPFATLGTVALVPALALLASLLVDAAGRSLRDDAVVLVEVEGRRGDGLTYSPSHSRPFPPGTEVRLAGLRRGGDPAKASGRPGDAWTLVELLDGSESWVPERALERVLP